MIGLGCLTIYLGRPRKTLAQRRDQAGRESGGVRGASAGGRSGSPRIASARPLAASAVRPLPNPRDAGPGDAVLPPGRSTRPGPVHSTIYPPCRYLSTVPRSVRCGTRLVWLPIVGWPARTGRLRVGRRSQRGQISAVPRPRVSRPLAAAAPGRRGRSSRDGPIWVMSLRYGYRMMGPSERAGLGRKRLKVRLFGDGRAAGRTSRSRFPGKPEMG